MCTVPRYTQPPIILCYIRYLFKFHMKRNIIRPDKYKQTNKKTNKQTNKQTRRYRYHKQNIVAQYEIGPWSSLWATPFVYSTLKPCKYLVNYRYFAIAAFSASLMQWLRAHADRDQSIVGLITFNPICGRFTSWKGYNFLVRKGTHMSWRSVIDLNYECRETNYLCDN